MDNNKNRIAIITGVGRKLSIGTAIAKTLAKENIDLFITYYKPYNNEVGIDCNINEPDQIIEEIKTKFNINIYGLELDLSIKKSEQILFDKVNEMLGSVDILINTACYSGQDGLLNLTDDILDKHYNVNIKSNLLLCKEFLKRWKKSKNGRIINFSTGSLKSPMEDELAYAATKAAIDGVIISLSKILAEHGITINSINPGPTDNGWMTEEVKKEILQDTPMGRLGTPNDAANLIKFLISPEAEWITGQIICSSGGYEF